MRIALVHNFATRVSTLESGGKISGKPLAPLFNNNDGGNNDKGEGNEVVLVAYSHVYIMDGRSKYECKSANRLIARVQMSSSCHGR
jgi:hypothetical protein